MRVFKKILLISMIIIFMVSVIFNVIICGSSNGTLIFKHSDDKMIAMASADRLNLTPNYFISQKNESFQFIQTSKENDTSTTTEINISFDKNYVLTAFIKTNKKEFYYKENKFYDANGKEETSQSDFPEELVSFLDEINFLQDSLVEDLETTNTKAKIDFSFSPFYLIGIKYEIKDEDKKVTYKYDLKGRIRNITLEITNGKTTSYSLHYKDKTVSIPNLSK